ncbi:bifunctional adenosylcobinamide kinase/adenosylcobinamide-phosphate guanylyltransferase [Silvanigrella aquatica]|uniref:Adenosylcobinamide kinase n=1 Tax=Silvanigrella aquatica TaxID=1915309 RepID=A0A1L4CZG9_9BACT|nr:bifunctional adenosylcobinamide kinase/adenosylcobinamide-phosphate guanylyltransferase [Silvanigrella aquatica]APJ03340.1 hypothetical protein AXG55_05245 [Silvanigrella aquatica]
MQENKFKISLFLGGGQSGKSLFAENCAKKWHHVVYYATGGLVEKSPEWEFRIQNHRARRPEHWKTIEHPVPLEEVVKYCEEQKTEVLLVDCLTLWMGWQMALNIQNYSPFQLLKHLENETQHFINQLKILSCPVLVVSNEVGEGVIPGSESGRIFREALGNMNLAVGSLAQCITFSIAGQHLLLKNMSQNFINGFCPMGIVDENFIFTELNKDPLVGENNVNK